MTKTQLKVFILFKSSNQTDNPLIPPTHSPPNNAQQKDEDYKLHD